MKYSNKKLQEKNFMEIKQYTKKPVAIEAIQLTNKNHSEIIEWLSSYNVESYTLNSSEFYVKTLEGDMKANVGDYIIKGVKNEFYPCREDIFKMTYDEHN